VELYTQFDGGSLAAAGGPALAADVAWLERVLRVSDGSLALGCVYKAIFTPTFQPLPALPPRTVCLDASIGDKRTPHENDKRLEPVMTCFSSVLRREGAQAVFIVSDSEYVRKELQDHYRHSAAAAVRPTAEPRRAVTNASDVQEEAYVKVR